MRCPRSIVLATVVALLSLTSTIATAEEYKLGSDSQRQEGMPKGTVTKHEWKSNIFEGTVRDYLSRLFRKVGVKNRTELAVWAMNHRGTAA